jgi:hypothetical protein
MENIIVYHNEQGERIERQMNAEELAQLAKDKAKEQERKDEIAARLAAKAAAEAKLAALGLTADDLKALGL